MSCTWCEVTQRRLHAVPCAHVHETGVLLLLVGKLSKKQCAPDSLAQHVLHSLQVSKGTMALRQAEGPCGLDST